jgi:tetratricopeptide (TPR) repeat protein
MHLLRKTVGALAACSCLTFGPVALAHDGPEHEIEELTERIKVEGESADLLLQRAIEYNVLRKGAEAVKDLQRALDFDSRSAVLERELSRAYFSIGKTNEALETVTRGLKYAVEGPEKASLYLVRAGILRARKDYAKAFEDVDKAIREHPDSAEAYLYRSQLQRLLDMKKERIKGLEEGIKETGSGLLEAEWIDALIDGGKADAALEKIETELRDSRLRSSWLIRRAKVYFAQKKDAEAKEDLKEAIEELNKRLRGSHDPLLLADRGQANELLGKKDEAKKDYEQARDKGISDEWVRRRIQAIDDEKKAKEKKDAASRKDAGKDKDEGKGKDDSEKSDKADDKPENKSDDDTR